MRAMIKIGIILLPLSFILLYLSAMNFQGGFSNSNVNELNIPPQNSVYLPFNLSNYSAVGFLYYTNGIRVNYYMLDSQAFDSIRSSLASGAPVGSNASSLEGNGALEIIYNSTAGMFPYQQSGQQNTTIYVLNSSPIIPGGEYYNVFENPSKSNATLFYVLTIKTQAEISSNIFSTGIYAIIGIALLVGGIIIIFYAIITRPKKDEPEIDEQIKELYASSAGRRQARRRPGRSARK
ncbi:MAG: hypothetical protein ACYCO0_03730 [Candidatus Micrarchaeaceae archaeon]